MSEIIELLYKSEPNSIEDKKKARTLIAELGKNQELRNKIVDDKSHQIRFMIIMNKINTIICDYMLQQSYIKKRLSMLIQDINLMNPSKSHEIDKRELGCLIKYTDVDIKKYKYVAESEQKVSMKRYIDIGLFLNDLNKLFRIDSNIRLDKSLKFIMEKCIDNRVWEDAKEYSLKHNWVDIAMSIRGGDEGLGSDENGVQDILKKIIKIK